jgi:hypothetical protein
MSETRSMLNSRVIISTATGSGQRWGEEELGYREAVELLGERGGFPELLLERLERLLAVLDLVPRERPGGRVGVGVERVGPHS